MAIQTIIDQERGLVVQRVQGRILVEEMMISIRKYYASEPVPDFPIFWDLQEAELLSLTLEEIQEVSDATKSFWPLMKKRIRIALLVSGDGDFGIARMFQILSDGLPAELKVFREQKEALQWLQGKEK